MRLVSIVGARPQFIKLAPVCQAIARHNQSGKGPRIEDFIVHTGQHYDAAMSVVFFKELDIPRADINLEVGSGSHGVQTARMLERLEALLAEREPDLVVIYGDTNSTVAAALAAAKLHFPIAHVEAGLRSFNRLMPEEINRVVADHVSDLLLAPTQAAMRNLDNENLLGRSVCTGDVMHDAVLHNVSLAADSDLPARMGLEFKRYAYVTIHRAESTHAETLESLLGTLNQVAERFAPVVFPVHPRTADVMRSKLPKWEPHPQLRLVHPLGYLDNLALLRSARLLLTDSGGMQKEAFFLNCPCVTLRTETEWVETVQNDANLVVGSERKAILGAVSSWADRLSAGNPDFSARAAQLFGPGDAAERVVASMLKFAAARIERR